MRFCNRYHKYVGWKYIRVNAGSPAATYTNMTKKSINNGDVGKQIGDMVPMKRFGKPEDIAKVIVFLLSSIPDSYTSPSELAMFNTRKN